MKVNALSFDVTRLQRTFLACQPQRSQTQFNVGDRVTMSYLQVESFDGVVKTIINRTDGVRLQVDLWSAKILSGLNAFAISKIPNQGRECWKGHLWTRWGGGDPRQKAHLLNFFIRACRTGA